MKIEAMRVVAISYEVETEGEVVDRATEQKPLDYIQGMHMIIPKLEATLEGMDEGQAFDCTIAPEDAYGEYALSKVFDSILHPESAREEGASVDPISMVSAIPEIMPDNTDRNRTSPFAFTGNRFEFRAVGSSANCSGAITTLSSAVADQLLEFKAAVDKEMAAGKKYNVAIMDVLKPIIASVIDVVCFDGNGYSEEWQKEAAKRGLDTETSVPVMFKAFTEKKTVDMFKRLGVFSEKELEARTEVRWETYIKKVQIEARVTGRMATNHILPAAVNYQSSLLGNIDMMRKDFPDSWESLASTQIKLVKDISALVSALSEKVEAMVEARKKANVIEDIYEKALAYHAIADSLFSIRKSIDKLEEITDNDLWPLPKYREILFIN